MSESNRWIVGLDTWIIQDGNYGEFTVGDTAEFALEFYASKPLERGTSATVACRNVGGSLYQVDARVVWTEGRVWIIDFGVAAYCTPGAPAGVAAGDAVRGEIYVGIDCFSYRDDYARRPGIPPLVHTWRIVAIRELTTPMPPSNVFIPDENTAWTSREVRETDAWNEPAGLVMRYELVCDRLDAPPRHRPS